MWLKLHRCCVLTGPRCGGGDSKTTSALSTDAFMDFTSGILSVTGINATAHIFASYPARHLSVLGGFIDQVSSARCDPATSDPPSFPSSDSK